MNNLEKIIILYSERKIKIKLIEENSMLKPLTNSLSLSEKSKGIRLFSTRKIIIIIKKKNKKKKLFLKKNLKLLKLVIIEKIKKNKRISIEILCLLDRILPIKEYFEFLKIPSKIKK
jgi:hypothetical protein